PAVLKTAMIFYRTDAVLSSVILKFFQKWFPRSFKSVPAGGHAPTDGTHTGKFSGESVRGPSGRVHGSPENFVPRGILGGRNFCCAHAHRNGFPLAYVRRRTSGCSGGCQGPWWWRW